MIELISRESLLKKYDAEHKGQPGRARQLIEEEPTVEERKRGRWLHGDKMKDYPRVPYKEWEVYCSECGNEALEALLDPNSDDAEYALTEYCPFCGAKMEGEEHEHND